MKYKFNAFIVSTLLLSSVSFTLAVSGACSGHGGVSCSAGQDSDGSVICVDGWRNSSVSYASMLNCGGSKSTVNTQKTNSFMSLFKKLKFW